MADGMTDDYPEQIKSLRAKLGLTQVALAKRLGVSFPTVNRWENGKSRPSQLSWQAILDLRARYKIVLTFLLRKYCIIPFRVKFMV